MKSPNMIDLIKYKMDKREEIVSRLNAIQEQEDVIRKELNAYDYENRFAKAGAYKGKYYQEKNKHHPNYIRCVFAYDVDEKSCELKSIEVSYWKDQQDWYKLEFNNHFNPSQWAEDNEKWIEISKEEYLEHYAEVQKRIGTVINKTK